jgi:hypothetical protein
MHKFSAMIRCILNEIKFVAQLQKHKIAEQEMIDLIILVKKSPNVRI